MEDYKAHPLGALEKNKLPQKIVSNFKWIILIVLIVVFFFVVMYFAIMERRNQKLLTADFILSDVLFSNKWLEEELN